ncbi:hypothetical protein [Polyangium jinanense]|uniref:Uncharacterized protein n=1 Tax=Polyangium jinanense TaxID=2829994 RepID=A0A9X3X900_9BACT|nr:hypothetical protein [Polyangium jinanense]MDC3985949.1 hypothetical protein [Polyangium jinanense]
MTDTKEPEEADNGPPTEPGMKARPTIPSEDRWHIASCSEGRAIIRDQNGLFVGEVIEADAELIAAAPELLDLVNDLLDDLRRDHRIAEALALCERLAMHASGGQKQG